ncbi:MAG: molybdate ABC transporter permease subunit [Gammaproteobacteria bacterium]|nr:molybdate ABC transporter permease subunit [Gammaproteobacteria bacterium]NNJ51395.1 molybdate ABC transporter permease subunit [Gammaproteobacteria bacterium]
MFPGLDPLLLTAKLAMLTTLILLVIGTPAAWWLANTSSRIKPVIEAVVALPIVLPPTVLGFYLLVIMSPQSTIGSWWVDITGQTLTFSFSGLVIASVIYSLPFVVQPIQNAFESVGRDMMEAAYTLGAKPLDAFFTVAVPLAKRGFLTGGILGFAHTLGEFGVVLMVGGNIPGETRVASIAIYDHVEMLEYDQAHVLAAILLAFAFGTMLFMYLLNHRLKVRS